MRCAVDSWRVRTSTDFNLLKAFAAELKARRTVLGMNQEALAFDADMNRTFVAKLELGQTSPSLTSLYKLAAALHVEPADMVASLSKRYEKEKRSAKRAARTAAV